MNARRAETLLWTAQRLTAALLALLVTVHLATIIYAVRGGLTAAEILARTRASVPWAAFYTIFVLACAIHGAIGLRTVAGEWLGWRGRAADASALGIALALAAVGLRAVAAVSLP
jgi:succinate dehydrogenase subunit C